MHTIGALTLCVLLQVKSTHVIQGYLLHHFPHTLQRILLLIHAGSLTRKLYPKNYAHGWSFDFMCFATGQVYPCHSGLLPVAPFTNMV